MLTKLLKIMRGSKDHPWLEDLNPLDPTTQTLDPIQPTRADPLSINPDPTQTQIGQTRLLVGQTLILPTPTLTPLILTLVQANLVLVMLYPIGVTKVRHLLFRKTQAPAPMPALGATR